MCVQFTLIKQHVACCEVGGGWGLTLRLANDPLQLEKASHCSANLMLHLHQAVCVYPVFHCAGELESVLYTVLYWFSNGAKRTIATPGTLSPGTHLAFALATLAHFQDSLNLRGPTPAASA